MNDYITNQSNQFEGKIVIVTGSTQGSGAETAKLFAARGSESNNYLWKTRK
jgi:NADP-dependent 3-hydroxy acid dehydrogenase YdfG